MSKSLRFAPAFTAIAMASALAGCAAPQFGTRSASNSGATTDPANAGVATRALAALNAQDYPTAVKFAEQAVASSPNVAGFRSLLGNAYFGSGRFASAEAAYRDSLTLDSYQPQVIVKLALVEIAQGKNAEVVPFLASSRGMLDPADYGLAMALAGHPQDAIDVLEPAARQVGADARVRQNLALSYALTGDWDSARTIAAQDVPANLVDARIQQWMLFAKPAAASDQVAALTGFRPVSGDPGQPNRLALRTVETRTAAVAPTVEQAPVEQAAPQQVAELIAQPQPAPAPAPEPVAQPRAADPGVAAKVIAAVAETVAEMPAALAEFVNYKPQPKKAKAPAVRAPVRHASLTRATGNSTSVVQLGAYGSPERVAAAWNAAARSHAMLRDFSPTSARFNSPKGLVYRLAVKGFSDASQAKDLCLSLRRAGGSCFVRTVAGDVPVRLASR
ncbi:MAG: tetratricopeptide repeat protein [Sphingomicrobium sp.]